MMRPMYNTKTFTDIYDDLGTFKYYYNQSLLPAAITDSNMTILYYLLYAKYGNNPIINMDENQFIAKVNGIIWQYGPSWQKRLVIQDEIRALTADDLLQGAKAIYNHAYNPETEPSTGDIDELTYINEQNTTNYKKSKMDAYGQLWTLIATDVTEEFLARFKPLFKQFVKPVSQYLYVDEED